MNLRLVFGGAAIVGAGLAATIVGACSVGDIDIANRECPCGAAGWVCDAARNRCVLASELALDGSTPAPDAADPDGSIEPPDAPKPCTTSPDSCAVGTYCVDATKKCAPGCKADAECEALSPTAPFCNVGRHQCVECREDKTCGATRKCSPAGACTDACTGDGGTCTGDRVCCAGLCIDTSSDINNCNGCGNACTGGDTQCCGGSCTNPLTNAAHCGNCTTACSTTNGTPSCASGTCQWQCNTGFSHCGSGNTGCDTNTATSVTQCGSCTKNCNTAVVFATGVSCVQSQCTFTACMSGHGDCDTVKANGCECTCGANNQMCCPPNAACVAGQRCESDNKCH